MFDQEVSKTTIEPGKSPPPESGLTPLEILVLNSEEINQMSPNEIQRAMGQVWRYFEDQSPGLFQFIYRQWREEYPGGGVPSAGEIIGWAKQIYPDFEEIVEESAICRASVSE